MQTDTLTKLKLLLAAALTLTTTSAAAQRVYRVKVDSIPQGAAVYLEAKEAGVQGYTPHTFKLKRGTYTFMLEADGYQPFARTVKVTKTSSFTFTMVKKPDPAVLTVNAAAGSSAEGATVKINGKSVGKVPMKVSLQPGRYLLEVEKEGHNTHKQWLDVQQAEKRTLVIGLALTSAKEGSILVSANIAGAEIYVDGRKVDDTAPALLEKIKPGKHHVEVRAKGHLPARQDVVVAAGKTVKVNLELQPDKAAVAASSGTLMILANEKDAEISVDGEKKGKAPVKVEGLVEGSHLVEARKEGFEPAEQTVEIKRGEFKTIKLALKEKPPPRKTGAIRVVSPTRGANVFIDGVLAGKTPLLRHQIDPGPHFVSVRREGFVDQVQTVEVKAGQIAEVRVELKKTSEETPASQPSSRPTSQPVEEQPSTLGLSSYGGHLVPPSYFTGDVSLGFPHILEGRLTAGFFNRGMFGMDGGVEFRTYGAVSEIGIHAKLRFFRTSSIAAAALFHFGGGGGPSSRNTVYANLGVVASMWFKKMVTFSARAYFNFYSDRHCPGSAESGELDICSSPQTHGLKDLDEKEMRARFSGTRFMLAAVLEIPLNRRFNLFFAIEGAPFQGNRRAYTDAFADLMPDSDPGVYGRVGGTFKY
jgi:hypothetical protein